MEKKELKKYSVKTKFFRAITYGVLVLLALICIVPFYNMIINCTCLLYTSDAADE